MGVWCGEPSRGVQRFCEGTREVRKGTGGLGWVVWWGPGVGSLREGRRGSVRELER